MKYSQRRASPQQINGDTRDEGQGNVYGENVTFHGASGCTFMGISEKAPLRTLFP
jgi:hypothetical protein